jgi:hypothetical protein
LCAAADSAAPGATVPAFRPTPDGAATSRQSERDRDRKRPHTRPNDAPRIEHARDVNSDPASESSQTKRGRTVTDRLAR